MHYMNFCKCSMQSAELTGFRKTKTFNTIYCIQENICGGNLSCFEWIMVIRGKMFAVAFLYTCIANWQGHDLQERFMIKWKTVKVFPCRCFAICGPCICHKGANAYIDTDTIKFFILPLFLDPLSYKYLV